MSINARGTFAMTAACLPFMREAGFGHVITQSPPITTDKLAGMTAFVRRCYAVWPKRGDHERLHFVSLCCAPGTR